MAAVDGDDGVVDVDDDVGDAVAVPYPQRQTEKHNLLGGWEAMKCAEYRSEAITSSKTNAELMQLYSSKYCSRDFLLDTE